MPESTPPPLAGAGDVEPVSGVLRVFSAAGALLVFLLAFILSVGAVVGAPLGIYLIRRWAIRHNRRASRIASIIGAILTSTAASAVLWLALFAAAPRPSEKDLETAVADAQKQPPPQMPEWYTRVFPQAARMDSATNELVRSPAFLRVTLVFAFAFMALFFGALGGTLGWCSSRLLRVAWSGRRAV